MKRYRDPLFAPERRRHPALIFLVIFLSFVLATLLVFNHINNSRVNLSRQNVTVPNLPSALERFRILHISDLHGLSFGAGQERLADTLAGVSYDIVCITGDITGKDGSIDAFLDLVDIFPDDVPVYFIIGDEDPAPILAVPHGNASAKADYILEAESHGAIYLDAPQKITVGKANLWIYPEWVYTLDVDASETAYSTRYAQLLEEPESEQRAAAMTAVEYQQEQLQRIRAARRETLVTDIHIALTHHPLQLSALENMQAWTASENDSYVRTISLVLSGHYCGGQWRLPFVGAVRVPESAGVGNKGWFPGDQKVVGFSTFLGIPQYISPGLGASEAIGLPAFRLFNTPTVTQITLTSKLTN